MFSHYVTIGLSFLIKRYRLAVWIKKKTVIQPYAVYKRLILFKDTNRLKVKRLKKVLYADSNKKKSGVGKPVSDKLHFKSKEFTRDKIYYILTKVSIQHEDVTAINICTSNNRS